MPSATPPRMTLADTETVGATDAEEGSLMCTSYPPLADEETGVDKEAPEGHTLQKNGQSRQLVLVAVQLCCTAAVGGYCVYASTAEPAPVGFFCNDDSIRFPLLKQTVPATEATLIVLLFPLSVMLLVDWVAVREFKDRLVCSTPIDLGCCRVSPLLRCYYRSIGGFVFSMLCAIAVTLTGKICVGRLRPHFIAACRPDWNHIHCSDATGFLYVGQYQCTSEDTKAIKEARMSFPSGHSSTSMCAMVYLVLFLQSRFVWFCQSGTRARDPRPIASSSTKVTRALWRILKGLCPFIQLLAFAVAFFIGISRIRDRYHHPTDVVTGFLVGSLAALYGAFYIASFGTWRESSDYATQKDEADPMV